MKTKQLYVAFAKIRIRDAALCNERFLNASDLAELHDYWDANMYGGLSALMDEGGAELDRWIRSGEMRAEALEIMAAATRATQ